MSWIDQTGGSSWEEEFPYTDAEAEHIYQELARKCWELARSIPPEEFLILRMHMEAIDADLIATRLGKTTSEISRKISELESTAGDARNAPNRKSLVQHLSDLAEHGQTTLCEEDICGEAVKSDERFCNCCGQKNRNFQHPVFLALRGRSLVYHRYVECRKGHPRAIFLKNDGFCTMCGVDLEPLTQTDSE